jgi:uncharacterized protein YbjT (DUF2867 family)
MSQTTSARASDDHAPVLVTGATGNTGAALVAELVRRGVAVRAMVRRDGDVARTARPGVSAVVADFDDDGSVAAALDGVRRAYLVTPSSERAEHQQVRFAEMAARAGLEHVAVLSQLGAAEHSPVRFLRYHAAVERRVTELGLGHTFLRPNLYFQGLFAFAGSIAGDGRFYAPIGEARVSAVDVRDIAEVAAAVLAAPDPHDATLTITGPQPLTHAEMAAALSDALARPVQFVDVAPDAFAESLQGILPPWQVAGLVEDYAHYSRGEAAETTSSVEDVTGHPPRSFAQFAHEHADVFR